MPLDPILGLFIPDNVPAVGSIYNPLSGGMVSAGPGISPLGGYQSFIQSGAPAGPWGGDADLIALEADFLDGGEFDYYRHDEAANQNAVSIAGNLSTMVDLSTSIGTSTTNMFGGTSRQFNANERLQEAATDIDTTVDCIFCQWVRWISFVSNQR